MKNVSNQKKVLIIGAGPSGLVTLKEMLAAGHDALILEQSSSFGGVFSLDNDKTYESLYLTSSNFFMAFSDFPPLESQIKYSSKKEYGKYLEAYVKHFNLLPYIKFNSKVKHAKLEDDLWALKIENNDEVFYGNNLIIATGSNQTPNMLPLKGFSGQKIHSSEYKNNVSFKDKRVLVIGIGESASDIAAEVCEVAKETVVWSRRPFLMAPRFAISVMKTKNYDEHKILSNEFHKYKHVNDFLEFITISRLANTLSLLTFSAIRVFLLSVWSTGITGPLTKLLSFWANQATKRNNYWQQDQIMVATKTSRIATMFKQEKLKLIISKSIKFDGLNVSFPETIISGDKETLPRNIDFSFDAIISCSGFKLGFDWLDADVEYNPRTWYKHCFTPNYGEKLMFIGWARPHQGGIPACSEMLARYGALLISGEKKLPKDFAKKAIIEGKLETSYYHATPHINTLVDYPAYIESIAAIIGCRPKAPSIWSKPSLFFRYWVYPNWPCWYRQNGPNANPAVLNNMMDMVPLKSSFMLGDGMFFVILHVSLLIFSFPFFLIFKFFHIFFPNTDSMRLRRGWLWSKSKGNILHGNKTY